MLPCALSEVVLVLALVPRVADETEGLLELVKTGVTVRNGGYGGGEGGGGDGGGGDGGGGEGAVNEVCWMVGVEVLWTVWPRLEDIWELDELLMVLLAELAADWLEVMIDALT